MSVAVELFGSEQVERARRYWRPRYAAALANAALGLALLAVLSFSAVLDPLDDRPRWAAAPAIAAITIVLGTLIRLPLGYWSFRYEHRWGFSTQTAGGWASDRAKGLAVALVLGGVPLVGLVALARAFPSWWPAVAATAAAGLVLLVSWAAPVVLEPIFNKAAPLEDEQLAAELKALAERAGVPVRDVLVLDASRRTRKLNAYVSGLGSTRRVVLSDTLAREAPRAEIELVVSHELGHRGARHVAKRTALGMAGVVGFVLVLWALIDPSDPGAIPSVLLLAALLEAAFAPLGGALSRRWEREADDFSLALTHDSDAFVAAHRRLALSNLADLDPPRLVYVAWFTHPTQAERIARVGAR